MREAQRREFLDYATRGLSLTEEDKKVAAKIRSECLTCPELHHRLGQLAIFRNSGMAHSVREACARRAQASLRQLVEGSWHSSHSPVAYRNSAERPLDSHTPVNFVVKQPANLPDNSYIAVGVSLPDTPILTHRQYEFSDWNRTEMSLQLPSSIAQNVYCFYEQYMQPIGAEPYNCYTFIAHCLRWPSTPQHFIEGIDCSSVQPVPDETYLKSGTPYAVCDEGGSAVHVMLGLAEPNRSLSVLEPNGELCIMPTDKLKTGYNGAAIYPLTREIFSQNEL